MNKEEISVAMLSDAPPPPFDGLVQSDVKYTVAANLVKFLHSDKTPLLPRSQFLKIIYLSLSAHPNTPLTYSLSYYTTVDERFTSVKL